MKRLPLEVQALFAASMNIQTFGRAIEELVYNSLDAKSTSIAIRVNVQDGKIQVVDNGTGISEVDMKVIGHKYMTSKFVVNTSDYGQSGQALASIIELSKSVKITSKHENSNNTYTKSFYEGKEQLLTESCRPSKGTTVDIEGFLYNRKIRKSITQPIREIQDIKYFLQRVSLIHTGTSISLRNDENYEVIFKLHKKRDIYQTLNLVYDIHKESYVELRVQKKSYEVTAFIGKDIFSGKKSNQILFLNNRFLKSCKLCEEFNKSLKKSLGLNTRGPKFQKYKRIMDEGETSGNGPFYFIFITCPKEDYEINSHGNKTILEFRNLTPINNVLEKLIQFYNGDTKPKKNNNNVVNNGVIIDNQSKVSKIVEKVFAGKKIGISQIQNGVKGKISRRSKKKIYSQSKDNCLTKKYTNCNEVIKNNDENVNAVNGNNKEASENHESVNIIEQNIPIQINEHRNCKSNKKSILKKGHKILKNKKRQKKGMFLVNAFQELTHTIQNRCNILKEKAQMKLNKNLKCVKGDNMTKRSDDGKEKKLYKEAEVQIRDDTFDKYQLKTDLSKPKMKDTTREEISNFIEDVPPKNYDLVHTILNTQKCIEPKQFNNINTKRNAEIASDYKCKLTFESHNYNTLKEHHKEITKQQRFITTQSIENFSLHQFKNPNNLKTDFKMGNPQRRHNRKRSIFNIAHSSYCTIEVSNTVDTRNTSMNPNFDIQSIEHFIKNDNFLNDFLRKLPYDVQLKNSCSLHESNNACSANIEMSAKEKAFSKYSAASPVIHDFEVDKTRNCSLNLTEDKDVDIFKTYTITSPTLDHFDLAKFNDKTNNYAGNLSVVFVSDSHHVTADLQSSLNPLEICETVFDMEDTHGQNLKQTGEKSFVIEEADKFPDAHNTNSIIKETTSHHFDLTHLTDWNGYPEKEASIVPSRNIRELSGISVETIKRYGAVYRVHKKTGMTVNVQRELEKSQNFNVINRPQFMPKGLSPILTKCNTKNACSYTLDDEIIPDEIFEEFMENIEKNAEIFDAAVENVKELQHRNIERANERIRKDTAILNFDGECLRDAKVLGQVDCKFIATKLSGKNSHPEHLVLFDQHAVHERIRLETNMAGYIEHDKWKSIPVDMVIKMKRDDLAYLHNYSEKFCRLGLKWTIQNDVLHITAIPVAIMGKNIRSADVIFKAVKMLLYEEIDVLKHQGGSISMYPKAIMELVFSEACRYAIKFGEKLSIQESTELLQELSKCRTPFQCAHGRPVMAVLMDIRPYEQVFKIDLSKLNMWKKKYCCNT